ncbi:MAG: CoA transferase [Actinobacteria bacterium]|nr:MAG: CoA transferase [Actinomycetota bacterium]
MSAAATDRPPLTDLRVLDLSRLQPGAYCTELLADLGADVVRVEQPGRGDPIRGIPGAHVAYNRGKRSITLDLKHERAPEVIRALARTVDVLIESGRPGSYDELGFGYAQLAADNPRLIWCAITGYGQNGPYVNRTGHDLTFLGYSGLLATMAAGTVPATPDFVMAVPYGALMAAVAILAAVHERQHTGCGRFIDISITDAATWVLGEHVARVAAGGQVGWGQTANRRAYRCADGELITVAAAEAAPWAALCAALDLPELASPGELSQAEIAERLAAVFATRPAREWIDLLADAGTNVAAVNRVDDLFDDPHVKARESLVTIAGADGDATVWRVPIRLDDVDGTAAPFTPGPPPAMGEHTDAVLAEAGFSPEEREQLRRDGVV